MIIIKTAMWKISAMNHKIDTYIIYLKVKCYNIECLQSTNYRQSLTFETEVRNVGNLSDESSR